MTPMPQNLTALIVRQATSTPRNIALMTGETRLTYAELDRRAAHVACALVAAGVTPAARVAICLTRGSDQIVSVLAVLRAGGVFVPLDPAQPPERLGWMLADAGAIVLITEDRAWPQGPPAVPHVMRVDRDRPGWRPDWRVDEPALPDPDTIDPDQPAYVIYTSGTTSRPKGVVVSHRNALHSTDARRIVYPRPVGTYLLVSTLAFDSAMAGLFWTLCYGGTLVLPSDDEHADPVALRRLISRHEVTHLLCLPSLYGWVLDDPELLRTLDTVIVAGEVCPRALVRRHHQTLPRVELHNEYGPTECAVWSTVHQTRADDSRDHVPIGRPIPGASIFVVNRPWELSPDRAPGEALIGGDGVSHGYLNRPDLTAERFVPDAWSGQPGARLYRTGDRVQWLEDGLLDYLGRLDRQVKVRGYRIELDEIEGALAAHPDLRECIVIPRGDQQALDAYVVPHPGVNNTQTLAPRLRAALAERLPSYMLPSDILVMSELPRTPNGKVDRFALARVERPPTPSPGALPDTSAEASVAALWAELLGRDAIGREDNFFDLGGHSLMAIEVYHRLRETLAPELRLVDLFAHPTVQSLAAFISRSTPSALATEAADGADGIDVRERRQALAGKRRAARVS